MHERYATFDGQRSLAEARQADTEDIKTLESVEQLAQQMKKKDK